MEEITEASKAECWILLRFEKVIIFEKNHLTMSRDELLRIVRKINKKKRLLMTDAQMKKMKVDEMKQFINDHSQENQENPLPPPDEIFPMDDLIFMEQEDRENANSRVTIYRSKNNKDFLENPFELIEEKE
uniref:Uncharacterized protein n=1 Tax=Heterorhabditis bacteriophora TaxID=37862 RepID=A0A1I7X5K1_HETBA